MYLMRPLPVRLHRVAATDTLNEIEIVVETFGPLAGAFSVSVMPGAGRRSAVRIQAKDFELVPESTSLHRKRVTLAQPGSVKVSLVARDGEVADEVEAGTPWAPSLVHEQFDSGFRQLQILLFGSPADGGQKDSRQFEVGVAWLLHLCGCAAMHLGLKAGKNDLQGSPDVVARTPGGDLLVGECSLKGPAPDKLGKLVERAKSIGAVMQRAGVPGGVRAVFFVGAKCSGDFPGVELVDRPRLERIVERLRSGRPDGLCWG
jgi:hypothetical protein